MRDARRHRLFSAHLMSACAHVAAFALVARVAVHHGAAFPRAHTDTQPDRAARSIELDLVAPPAASRRAEPPPALPSIPAPESSAERTRTTSPGARVNPRETTTNAGPAGTPGAPEVATATPGTTLPTAPSLPRGTDLLRALPSDVLRAGGGDVARGTEGPPDEATVVRERLGEYFREASNRERHEMVAGSSAYYRPLRQAVEREWRPVSARSISVIEGIAGAAFTTPEGYQRVQEAAGNSASRTQRSAAIDAMDSAHPNSPMLSNPPSPSARAEATARTTRAVVEVDQDPAANITAIRVVEGSGFPLFDAAARAAIERAVGLMPSRPMPGGWRSRWLFEVTRTRTPPPVGLLPSLPDQGPIFGATVGGTFDESTGTASVNVPFALNERRHVRVLWSRAMSDTSATRDGGA